MLSRKRWEGWPFIPSGGCRADLLVEFGLRGWRQDPHRAHPTLTFKSTKLEKTDDKLGTLYGDLTLLGVTRPAALDVTVEESVSPASKLDTVGFSARRKVRRVHLYGFHRVLTCGSGLSRHVARGRSRGPIPGSAVRTFRTRY